MIGFIQVVTLVLFGFGLLIAFRQSWRAHFRRRAVHKFKGTVRGAANLGALLGYPFPEVLAPAKKAWVPAAQAGTDPDLESPVLTLDGQMTAVTSALRPIASALIICALIATFIGMQSATRDLSESVAQVRGLSAEDAREESAGPPASPRAGELSRPADPKFDSFLDDVNGALEAMSGAFGVNILGVVFGAALLLLIPVVRSLEQNLLDEITACIEECVRPLLKSDLALVLDKFVNGEMKAMLQAANSQNADALREGLSAGMADLVGKLDELAKETRGLADSIQPSVQGALQAAMAQARSADDDRYERYSAGLEQIATLHEQVLALFGDDNARVEATVHEVRKLGEGVTASLGELNRGLASFQGGLTRFDGALQAVAQQWGDVPRRTGEELAGITAAINTGMTTGLQRFESNLAGALAGLLRDWRTVMIDVQRQHAADLARVVGTISQAAAAGGGAATGQRRNP